MIYFFLLILYYIEYMKYFCFDTEFGGLKKEFSLLTLYGEILDEELNSIDSIDLKLKPENGMYIISPEALKINRINIIEHDKDAISLKEASESFRSFISRHAITEKLIPLGHNVSIDIKFAKHHLMQPEEWNKYFSFRKMDTHSIGLFLSISGFLPKFDSYSLKTMADFFNLPTENLHDAKHDVKTTVEIIKKMKNLTKGSLVNK